jgi:hypothetical protein
LLRIAEGTYLSEVRGLAGLVLGDLVQAVLAALRALAVGPSFLRYVHHFFYTTIVMNDRMKD